MFNFLRSNSTSTPSIYSLSATRIDGSVESLELYKGKWLLVVNVASRCVFTAQYEGLESLYRKYQSRGLVVLGFPCNQFLSQEPATNSEIATFCSTRYQVTFPMFAKVAVNGPQTDEIYRFLKARAPSSWGIRGISWNFTKFLVYPDGFTVERFGPRISPEKIEKRLAGSLS